MCKSVSRVLSSVPQKGTMVCHLSSPDFTVRVYRSTHPGILPKQKSNEQLFARGLFDLSTHKVYHAPNVTIGAVGSYPTFSPLSR